MIKQETIRHRPSRRVAPVLLALAALLVASFLLVAKPAHASTTFTVDATFDSPDTNPGDGVCDAFPGGSQPCTLRAAIQEANAVSGADVINFNISDSSGVGLIQPTSELPAITDRVTIDGYSQASSKPNTLDQGTDADLRVWLFGNSAGSGADGLNIGAGGSGSVIKGLVIDSFSGDGILMDRGSTQNRIEGNFIGADPSGAFDAGNGASGVNVFGSSFNTIGGDTPAARNLISGNRTQGVFIHVGGNVTSNFNRVEGNLIGTKKDGTSALGNHLTGVHVFQSSNDTVSSNTIAFNGKDGVAISVTASTGNLLAGNSIFSNTEQGIDLNDDGVTANDGDNPNTAQVDPDSDTGPNDLQNFPVLTSAKTTRKGTIITGTLNSTPNSTFLVQFFSNASGGDEGQKPIGQVGVSTDGSGNASFTFKPAQKVGKGQKITATAINTASSAGQNTSEFSAAKKVVRKR